MERLKVGRLYLVYKSKPRACLLPSEGMCRFSFHLSVSPKQPFGLQNQHPQTFGISMTMETPPGKKRRVPETPEKVPERPRRPVCSAYVPPDYAGQCSQTADVQVLLPNGRAVAALAFCIGCFNQAAVAALYAQHPHVWLR